MHAGVVYPGIKAFVQPFFSSLTRLSVITQGCIDWLERSILLGASCLSLKSFFWVLWGVDDAGIHCGCCRHGARQGVRPSRRWHGPNDEDAWMSTHSVGLTIRD